MTPRDPPPIDRRRAVLCLAAALAPGLASAEPAAELQAAWASGDVAALKDRYAEHARYFDAAAVVALRSGLPFSAGVAEGALARAVASRAGRSRTVVGEPISVTDRMLAWVFAEGGTRGVSLARREQGRFLLHADILADPGEAPVLPDQAAQTLAAWDAPEVDALSAAYAPDAAVLSDEDLMQTPWRDHAKPPTLDALHAAFKGWRPVVDAPALAVGNLLLFAWGWASRPHPIGHGLRVLRFSGRRVDLDLRLALRPWEARGRSFLAP